MTRTKHYIQTSKDNIPSYIHPHSRTKNYWILLGLWSEEKRTDHWGYAEWVGQFKSYGNSISLDIGQ